MADEKPDGNKPEDAGSNPPNAEQEKEIFSGTAVFANKIYGTFSPLGVRLSFMETSPGGEERFRTAAYVAITEAFALKDLLDRNLKHFEFMVEQPAVAEQAVPNEGGE